MQNVNKSSKRMTVLDSYQQVANVQRTLWKTANEIVWANAH